MINISNQAIYREERVGQVYHFSLLSCNPYSFKFLWRPCINWFKSDISYLFRPTKMLLSNRKSVKPIRLFKILLSFCLLMGSLFLDVSGLIVHQFFSFWEIEHCLVSGYFNMFWFKHIHAQINGRCWCILWCIAQQFFHCAF